MCLLVWLLVCLLVYSTILYEAVGAGHAVGKEGGGGRLVPREWFALQVLGVSLAGMLWVLVAHLGC